MAQIHRHKQNKLFLKFQLIEFYLFIHFFRVVRDYVFTVVAT